LSPEISPKINETTKSKSKDAHVTRRGLLLVNGRKVFGDTAGDVDEVISPRFFFCLLASIWAEETINIQSNNSKNETT
jgi:hypothetical protein